MDKEIAGKKKAKEIIREHRKELAMATGAIVAAFGSFLLGRKIGMDKFRPITGFKWSDPEDIQWFRNVCCTKGGLPNMENLDKSRQVVVVFYDHKVY